MAYKYSLNPKRYLELWKKKDECQKTGQRLLEFELLELVSYSNQFTDYLIVLKNCFPSLSLPIFKMLKF